MSVTKGLVEKSVKDPTDNGPHDKTRDGSHYHETDPGLEICKQFFADITSKAKDYLNVTEKSIFRDKIYLIATYWTYPFGGGEEFMYDSMEWATNLGMKTFWIAFTDGKNKPFEKLRVRYEKYGTIIDIPGGFSVDTLSNWLYILKPDIVHHQGHFREKFFMATEDQRLEFISGFHFWNGGIVLDSEKKNTLMIESAKYHKTDNELLFLLKKERCNLYCASQYVQDCFSAICKISIPDIIFPAASINRYMVQGLDPWKSKYVVMINIHKRKGGELIHQLIKRCNSISFLCVRTEHGSEELDQLIENEILERNQKHKEHPDEFAHCVWMKRTHDVKTIYEKAKIMLCVSLVDETFCRVVNESMMNGIPVFTTCLGNIKYLVGESTPKLNHLNPDEWVTEIENIYYDETKYREMSERMKKQYEYASEGAAKTQFKNVMNKLLLKSKEMNIGIFTPWCDQGLGIQSRNYYNILNQKFNVSIFALKPYNADTCQALQKDPDKWLVKENRIYYSPNCREDVKDSEILEFCRTHNIGKMIMPETCWPRIFQVAKLLRENSVKAYAVPNIEIVRKDEVFKHNYFYKILANNYLCERVFEDHLDIPCRYVGYASEGIEPKPKSFDSNEIKFLFIGGMNAFSRKHVLSVCEGFAKAYESNNNLRLTVTIQMTNSLETESKDRIKQYMGHPGINILEKHLKYTDILDLYYTHHIGIQVSKHEGLGLGFYEAVSTGTPVLTLDTPPHNEIILDGINGWHIKCYHKEMTDNKSPLFGSAYFDPMLFAEKVLEIGKQEIIEGTIESLLQDNDGRLSTEIFTKRFINEII